MLSMKKAALIPFIFLSTTSAYGMPSWAKNHSQSLNGNIYKVICSGQGPAIDLARAEAVQSCKSSAAQILTKNTKVRSLSVETEAGVSYHQQIEENESYKNLTCTPEREEIEDAGYGSTVIWLLCRFDLSKAIAGAESNNQDKDTMKSDGKLQDQNLSDMSEKTFKQKAAKQESKLNKTLNVISLPGCTDLLVKGGRARSIPCVSNPTQVTIFPEDESILVRSTGFVPKEIKLKQKSWENHESVQVILEAH